MNDKSEILIIGGGIIGLAIAVELKLQGATVTVISRDFQEAASHAAAGMLAPHAEQISNQPLLDLCLKSRWLYPEWSRKLEDLSGLEVGYLPCGILAPVLAPPATGIAPGWLDEKTIRLYQPGLGPDVVGGWWHADDGQVDTRNLMKALQQAARSLGVAIREGVAVNAIQQRQGRVSSIFTSMGELEAQIYVLTAGSWVSQLLPLPVHPVKGQMLGLRMPHHPHQPLPIQRVIYGPQTYLVPRKDGRLIVGATSENVDWEPGNTPQGIQTLLNRAIRLYPALKDWAIEDFWWGFRPATADELPILGTSPCDNLILAAGHYRNGILLAPVTAAAIADLILHGRAAPLLSHFHYTRFYQPQPMIDSVSAPQQFASIQHEPNHPQLPATEADKDELIIAGRKFRSRLMTGTGKYPDIATMQQSVIASECQMVTVAVRRVQTNAPGHEGLAEALDWSKIWMLPNTAGCRSAQEAVRVAHLGREMAKLLGQEDNNFVKLEVIPDPKYLLPDPIGTLEAAQQLVADGFAVLPYINADPLLAKRLEEVGCATVMPLGSPIGSGQGIKNAANIAIIIEQARIPVVVDAGIGTPSEAAQAMEMGADALLINSAIALAQNPVGMAKAMGLATAAGRLAYLAGRMPLKHYASASSPLTGIISTC